METKIIKHSDIANCPKQSLAPQHYRDDGTCLCQHRSLRAERDAEVGGVMTTMSWRAARALLQDSGRGVNEAQDIIEDLAHWGPEHHGHSVRTPEGSVLRLRYAGLDEHNQPTYTTKVTYTPPQEEGDSQ